MASQKATTSGPVALFSGFPGGMWADAVAAVFPVGFRRCLFIPGKTQIQNPLIDHSGFLLRVAERS